MSKNNRVTPNSQIRPTSLGGQTSRLSDDLDAVLELEAMNRDPKNLNGYIQWEFNDILAEISMPRSVDM